MPVELAKATIVERRDVTPDIMVVKLEPSIPFTFKPGQYCTIGLQGIERAYSIVSSPHEPLLELFIELVPPPVGNLTPLLWNCKVGDQVTLRHKAKGLLLLGEKFPKHLMVSTVTGIVPYVSIIRNYIYRKASGHQFYVLQGASYRDEFTYKDEMEGLAKSHSFIKYVATVSRPQEERNRGWCGEKGRVNLVVEKHIESFGLSPEDTLVYACGHPGMIEDVKERLTPKGFKVAEERFWKS